ncbi:MAG: glycosyltransferase family 39 protein [Candidatus Kryptoniota bacterium]
MSNPVTGENSDQQIVRRERSPIHSIILSPWYIPTVVALGFAVRLSWTLIFHPNPVSDFAFYFRSAGSIARGYGYAPFGVATAYFPIGYPLFLAILFRVFGASLAAAETSNLIFSVATIMLAYWIARELFRSELAGRFTLLFLAIYPDNIAYTSLLCVETFHLFLLFLGVALLLHCVSAQGTAHSWRLLVAGLVLGFATLVKAQTFLLPGLILLLFPQFSWEWRSVLNRLKKISILYVALIAVLIPWLIRNYQLYDDFVISNNDGLNLYMGNGPEANGTYVAIPWFDVGNDTWAEYKVNKLARRTAVEYMEAHPLRILTLMPDKLVALFNSGDGVYWNIMGIGSASASAGDVLPLFDQINAIYELIVIAVFVVSILFGFWRRLQLGKGNGWPLLGVVVIVYFTGIYLVYYGAARYHFPIIPWMIMYAAALVSSLPATRTALRK